MPTIHDLNQVKHQLECENIPSLIRIYTKDPKEQRDIFVELIYKAIFHPNLELSYIQKATLIADEYANKVLHQQKNKNYAKPTKEPKDGNKRT